MICIVIFDKLRYVWYFFIERRNGNKLCERRVEKVHLPEIGCIFCGLRGGKEVGRLQFILKGPPETQLAALCNLTLV